jgi:branched-subunit amino acid transport protein
MLLLVIIRVFFMRVAFRVFMFFCKRLYLPSLSRKAMSAAPVLIICALMGDGSRYNYIGVKLFEFTADEMHST